MHIHFSGIGGTGIGPLALIAHKAGFTVSGTDKQHSAYIEYLKDKGISTIAVPDSEDSISEIHAGEPIDWVVYSSALPKENPNHPVITFAAENQIKHSKRDEFLAYLLEEKHLKMLAIAGTHGKTTTTAMAIWLFKQMNIPVSYSVGAKLSFGDMGEYDENSEYFVYEADEYDRNFLHYSPAISLISGLGYDHPDIYPTREEYNEAFLQFFSQSDKTYIWENDVKYLGVKMPNGVEILRKNAYQNFANKLLGNVNRENAALVAQAFYENIDSSRSVHEIGEHMNSFPGVSRRFEQIAENIYSDYAHTPEKIAGAINIARESLSEGQKLVVVYEGLHNTRQHFIKEQLTTLFEAVDELIVVPSYRAREDESLEDLTPEKLVQIIQKPEVKIPAELNENLKEIVSSRAKNCVVLCLTAGGGGSLDEWLRKNFS